MPGLFDYYTHVLGLPLAQVRYLDADLVIGRRDDDTLHELAWGDAVSDVSQADGITAFRVVGGSFHGLRVRVKGNLPLRDAPLLRLSMIDVQQGEGLVLETPDGQVVLIDGGDNKLFARHLAARFARTSADRPLEVDAIVVTHGDADHFAGLSEIVRSETLAATASEPDRERKRVFLHAARVLHNGLVKAPGSVDRVRTPDLEMLGDTVEHDGRRWLTRLVERPDAVATDAMNEDFRRWCDSLVHWDARRAALGLAPAQVRRVGTDTPDAFDFLAAAGLGIDLIGPRVQQVGGVPALPFLRKPLTGLGLHLPGTTVRFGSPSASHTINGHSIAFRLRHGRVRFMLTGDLNRESMQAAREQQPDALPAEVLKVPHHGSHDFDLAFIGAVGPMVSLVSSGDEHAGKEHIHPRANLMACLGRAGRDDSGIVFVTELAAFFRDRGNAVETEPRTAADRPAFYAFERTNFGIVHLRSDGQRLLAFTHSGKKGLNEAYAFDVLASGEVRASAVRKVSAAPRED